MGQMYHTTVSYNRGNGMTNIGTISMIHLHNFSVDLKLF